LTRFARAAARRRPNEIKKRQNHKLGDVVERAQFIDFYEVLEISPNANSETIDRIFRYFAQRYHPDNPESGDRARFDIVMEAHNTLKDPERRAQYDIQHKQHSDFRWKLADEASDAKGVERDVDTQNRMLSLLYVKRRQNISDPGIGNMELERLLGCPAEHLEFHIWYLREKVGSRERKAARSQSR